MSVVIFANERTELYTQLAFEAKPFRYNHPLPVKPRIIDAISKQNERNKTFFFRFEMGKKVSFDL